MVEIAYILSFEIRAIVFIIDPVTEVPVPDRVVIIHTPGKFIFIDYRSGIISFLVGRSGSVFILINGSGLINDRGRLGLINHRRRRRSGINPYSGQPETYMCVDIYL